MIPIKGVSMQDDLLETVENLRDEMKNSLMEMLKIPAIGPDNDGDGEAERAEFLMRLIQECGFDEVKRYDAKDHRTTSGIRPNIVAIKKGSTDKNVLILVHMDIVPEGDLDEWDTDPYEPVFKDGKIYGRGAEDNGQALISALYAAKALTLSDITPKYNLKVILVSDEETGSEYGVEHILDEGLVSQDDLVIVPDHSEDHGKKIVITEKSAVWVKITVHGKQGHAAMPDQAINANRLVSRYISTIDTLLHTKFCTRNEYFSPPYSTFEPTKRLSNVPNTNTIPGKEVQFFDCRVVPEVSLSDVKRMIEETAKELCAHTDATMEIDYTMEKESPPGTPEDAEVVLKLRATIEEVLGFTPELCGIGGGTVASHFRERNIPAVVWSTSDEIPHQPNEYSVLDYMVDDCKVFSRLVL